MKICERIMFIFGNYGRIWVQVILQGNRFDLEGIAFRLLAGLLNINSKSPDRIFQIPDI